MYRIEGENQEFWFAPALLEFVDHRAGATMGIENRRFARGEDGEWREGLLSEADPPL
jgi:hypothetical protein